MANLEKKLQLYRTQFRRRKPQKSYEDREVDYLFDQKSCLNNFILSTDKEVNEPQISSSKKSKRHLHSSLASLNNELESCLTLELTPRVPNPLLWCQTYKSTLLQLKKLQEKCYLCFFDQSRLKGFSVFQGIFTITEVG